MRFSLVLLDAVNFFVSFYLMAAAVAYGSSQASN